MKNSNALDLDKSIWKDLSESNLKSLADLIAQVSWWVNPVIYHDIQVVYPKTRRKKGKGEERGQTIKGIRIWGNEPAQRAFWFAVGKTKDDIENSNICHIYNGSVLEPDHFTNLANVCV